MRIFLSHASEQAEFAESITIALRGERHEVFFDRSSLPSGEAYHDRIRMAIADSDLFIFLVSPEAVTKGRYTITELEFAQQQWSNPSGHVLPVVVRQTELSSVPVYLKAVTLLEPQGNIPAAVAAAVGRMANPRWSRLARQWAPALVIVGLVGAGLLARSVVQQRRRAADVSALLASGRLGHETRNYAAGWESYDHAASLAPANAEVVSAREQLAMEWLDNIRITPGQDTFAAIVEKVEPVISQCAARQTGRAADCLAHLGWGAFLRSREGAGGLDPVQYYRRALDLDPHNVYGHAMWGFELLRTGRSVAEAKEHFDQALASGQERAYVRSLQLAGLVWGHDADAENEAIRVANDMRLHGESWSANAPTATTFDRSRLWNIYHDRVLNRNDLPSFFGALSSGDHLATFEWLFPESEIATDKRDLRSFMLATFQEQAGQRTEALATFLALRDSLARNGGLASGGPLPDRTVSAVRRLSQK